MTDNEAIDILDDTFTYIDTHGYYSDEEAEEARQLAIKALQSKRNMTNEAMCQQLIHMEAENERLREMLSCYQWVSVKDRLPLLSHEDWNNDFQVYKSSTRVLITVECNPDYIFTGVYTDTGWMSDGRILDDVIAWMPLPTPYVETKEVTQ